MGVFSQSSLDSRSMSMWQSCSCGSGWYGKGGDSSCIIELLLQLLQLLLAADANRNSSSLWSQS